MLPVEKELSPAAETDWTGLLLLASACVAFVVMCGMRLMW
jgi:hypothetical protein